VERVHARDELRRLLESRFRSRPTEEWVAALTAAEVPVGEVRDLARVFSDPQVEALGMVATIAHPTVGDLRLTGLPWSFSATPGSIRRPPPLMGEHADEVLAELDYDAGAIAGLRRDGII
jgi:crotonobetainyl-CoA:carnitine CoA-transferase CaiB-like acyl-CoA transferase